MKDGHSDDEILDGLRTLCVMDREAGVERNKQPDYFPVKVHGSSPEPWRAVE